MLQATHVHPRLPCAAPVAGIATLPVREQAQFAVVEAAVERVTGNGPWLSPSMRSSLKMHELQEGIPPSMTIETSKSTWADYRQRMLLLWAVLVPGLVIAVASAEFVLIQRMGAHGLMWPLIAWAAAVAWAVHRLQRFLCPRCGLRFFRRSPPLLALLAKRCVHCMNTKY